MFSPSLVCETSAVSIRSSYSPTTMASADFSSLPARGRWDLPW